MKTLNVICHLFFSIPFFIFLIFLALYYFFKTRNNGVPIEEKLNHYWQYSSNFYQYGEYISSVTWIIIIIRLTFF
jgi:hypothetical protein